MLQNTLVKHWTPGSLYTFLVGDIVISLNHHLLSGGEHAKVNFSVWFNVPHVLWVFLDLMGFPIRDFRFAQKKDHFKRTFHLPSVNFQGIRKFSVSKLAALLLDSPGIQLVGLSYRGWTTFINDNKFKDPYEPTSTMESTRVFLRCSCGFVTCYVRCLRRQIPIR